MASNESPGRFRRATRGVGRASGRLANGLPLGFLAALAALVLVAILFTVASREPAEPRGYAEVSLVRGGCVIDQSRELNTVGCQVLGPRAYRIVFTKSLAGSTPVASHGSCCPGEIGASVEGDRNVIVAVRKRVRSPIRVSVYVP